MNDVITRAKTFEMLASGSHVPGPVASATASARARLLEAVRSAATQLQAAG